MTSPGVLAPVLAVAGSGARRRRRSNLTLGAIVAATVGLALACLIGAQRAETAFDRLRAVSHSSDVRVYSDADDFAETFDVVARIDGVAEAGAASEMFVRPVGSELFPDYQLLAIVARPDLAGASLDTPRIVTGRAAHPDAVDEVVLSEALAAELDIEAGDTIELESFSNAWVDIAFNGGDPGPPDGPVVSTVVVGLARTPADFGRFAGRLVHLTPAFAARFEDQILTYTWLSARAVDSSPRGLEALAAGALGEMEVDESFFQDSEATQDGLTTIAVSLRLLALAGVVAGITAIGLTADRLAREALTGRSILAAIGCTRGQLVLLVALTLGPWVLAGIVAGLVLGTVGAPRAAVGLAQAVDPDLGVLVVQPTWIALVALGSLVILGALVGAAALRAARPPRPVTGSGVALPALDHPLVVRIAVRRALFGAPDRGGRASRGAAVALAAAVVLAVAALVVSASIERLQDDPSLSGQGDADQRAIESGEALDVYEGAMRTLEADDRVADLTGAHIGFVSAGGAGELPALVLDVRRGDVGSALIAGRLPVQPDEVAFGPASLEAIDGGIGDDVELVSEQGAARFRIVGVSLFPEGDFKHDWGVTITVDGADRFLGGVDGTQLHQAVFRWAPGVDATAADRSLEEQGLRVLSTSEGLQPAVVSNLDEVRDLPLVLAAMVIVLGLVTLVHALIVTTRRRDREAGTLRALGVRPRSISALTVVQSIVMAVVGLVVGIPLGLALGRQLWVPLAARAHVIEIAVRPWTGIAWVVLAVVLGGLILAGPVSLGSVRRSPADDLRSE